MRYNPVTRTPCARYLLAVGVVDPGVPAAAGDGVLVDDPPPGTQATSGLRLPNIASMSADGWREAMVMLVLATAPTQMVVFLSCVLWMHWVLLLKPGRRGASEKLTGPIFGST